MVMRKALARATLAIVGAIDAAIPARLRRSLARSAVGARSTSSGPAPPPLPETFEATVRAFDGTTTTVVATATPGNQTSGPREPPANERTKEPEPPGSLSIAEGSGHPAGQRGRLATWAVVALIVAAFTVGGVGLVLGRPWLSIGGLAAVVVGGILGWAFGIMADRGEADDQGDGARQPG